MGKTIFDDKKQFVKEVKETVRYLYRKQLEEATQQEIFQAVSYVVKDVIIDDWLATQQAFDKQDPKIVYYMSMEFLMGRALGNNLINLKAYNEVKEALEEIGLNLDVIEDQEPDPAAWKRWSRTTGSLLHGVSCHIRIRSLRLPGSVTVTECSSRRSPMVSR